MLLPDRGVGGDCEERGDVGRPERPQLDEVALQVRLRIEPRRAVVACRFLAAAESSGRQPSWPPPMAMKCSHGWA